MRGMWAAVMLGTVMLGGGVLAAGGALAQWSGDGPARPAYQAPQVVNITERDSYRNLRLTVGSEIRARLRQAGGTAYRWEVLLNDNLALIGQPVTEDAGQRGGYGAPQTRVFRLRVVRPGRFQLYFGLRGQGRDAPGQERVALNIDAVAAGRPVPTPPRPQPRPEDATIDGPDTIEPLTEADAGDRIDIPVGQERTIALPSNVSTGYRWEATGQSNLVIVGGIEEERPARASGLVGGGGTTLVSFRILRRGPAGVTLLYLPPGGGRAAKVRAYRFVGI